MAKRAFKITQAQIDEAEEIERPVVKKRRKVVRQPTRPAVNTNLHSYLKQRETAIDSSAWEELGVSKEVRHALEKERFANPTNIQQQVLPVAIQKKLDVFGAAETGSGKTLAFVLPILENLIAQRENSVKGPKKLSALVLAPTRELVVQIERQFKTFAQFTEFRSAAIVGGLSEERQERLLSRQPDVIVATPGRYWSLCAKNEYAGDLSALLNVVVDEIDRMLEKGHFKEMTNILERIHSVENPQLQTLVFSATLTFIVLPNDAKYQMTRDAKLKAIAKATQMKKNYHVADVTNEFATPESLKERRVCCQNLLEKDSRLYYILLTYPARTLIFTNSIDASQRLYGLLMKLQVKPAPLLIHAKMPERKRLKNLDRFSGINFRLASVIFLAIPKSILIATDVAARGLDIKGIENVVHYQIPRTAEDYIHRSGRTARALQKGMSIMILDPQDVLRYRKICKSLKRDGELPLLELDNQRRLDAIKHRCYVATEVEKLEYKLRKVSSAVNWRKRMAKEADLELSDEDDDADGESEEANKRRLKKSAEKALKIALSQPLPKSTL